ncbi:MAG: hypothetical protein AB1938_20195 [Myxococcota bacterium]
MSSTLLRRTLIGLEVFLFIGAFYGAGSLLNDPTGHNLQMPADRYLTGTPFQNYLAPAVILFAVNGMFPLVTVIATLMKMPWAKYAHLGVGALLTGWMVGQGVLVGFLAPIQYFFLVLGIVILALALMAWREERPGHGGPILHA